MSQNQYIKLRQSFIYKMGPIGKKKVVTILIIILLFILNLFFASININIEVAIGNMLNISCVTI